MPNKQDKKGRSKNPEGQFIKLLYAMLKSPAWRSLNGASAKLYLELHTRFYGTNNGDLSVSLLSGATDLGLSKSTLLRAFKELEEKGFLRKTSEGNWIRGRMATWALTTKDYNGKFATNEWRNWNAPERPSKPRKRYGTTKRQAYQRGEIAAAETFPGSALKPNAAE